MIRPELWFLIANRNDHNTAPVSATLAWIAEQVGAEFECYVESERKGFLFDKTGSSVLGGNHFQQFNYLNTIFDVKYFILGDTRIFESSIQVFDSDVIARTENPDEIYAAATEFSDISPEEILVVPSSPLEVENGQVNITPFLYPEIYFSKSLGLASGDLSGLVALTDQFSIRKIKTAFLTNNRVSEIESAGFETEIVLCIDQSDNWSTLTEKISRRWMRNAKGVAFGDPDMILSQVPVYCREKRVAVYAPTVSVEQKHVKVSAYTEQCSGAAKLVADLCRQTGSNVVKGRQTCDGDIFEWSKSGICIQISDPNRPPFPVAAQVVHRWGENKIPFDVNEPDDKTLERYAEQGKVLATLLWHSGEVAHNEAMLNVMEVANFTGVKMGIGVHADRYRTSPQAWELIGIPRNHGGVKGLVEPVLHSGGTGVLAEINCPPEKLAGHCQSSISQIREIAGTAGTPRGYYAFMDADLATLTSGPDKMYRAVKDAGIDYLFSSARPGKNLIVWQEENFLVLNQSCRIVCTGSPFVRVTSLDDILSTRNTGSPGWFVGTLDSPVVSFNPYVWKHGSRFMKIVEWITGGGKIVNVLPRTVARYARIMKEFELV